MLDQGAIWPPARVNKPLLPVCAPDMNNALLPGLFTRGRFSGPVTVKGTLDSPRQVPTEVALAVRIPLL